MTKAEHRLRPYNLIPLNFTGQALKGWSVNTGGASVTPHSPRPGSPSCPLHRGASMNKHSPSPEVCEKVKVMYEAAEITLEGKIRSKIGTIKREENQKQRIQKKFIESTSTDWPITAFYNLNSK